MLRIALQGAIEKSGINNELIDEVIAGQAKQSTDAPNIARVASLMARIPETVPSYTVHRQCASGMQAMLSGMQQIQCGYSETVLVGGVESMSTAPFYIRNARFGVGNGNTGFIDPNIESQPKSQPNDIYGTFNMIQTADNVARQFHVTREEQDEFALSSQLKAVAAIDAGRFKNEIIPVVMPQRKKDPLIFDTDEYPKRNTDMQQLAKLKPIFAEGFVTAGNASGRNDGASALVLMAKEKADQLGLKPLARIIAGAAAGVDPRIMGIGPVAATHKLMKVLNPQGLSLDSFELFEINEAFAAQSVACVKELGLNPERINVNGGAIALGHPLGCSGARISTTLVHEMHKRDVRYGMASICIAGGLGMAMAFEKL
ncbi:MAG: acetyl-CoA C-acyltransferase [Negativicutes bacterium]